MGEGEVDDLVVAGPGALVPLTVEEVALSIALDLHPGELLADPADPCRSQHLQAAATCLDARLLVQEDVDPNRVVDPGANRDLIGRLGAAGGQARHKRDQAVADLQVDALPEGLAEDDAEPDGSYHGHHQEQAARASPHPSSR